MNLDPISAAVTQAGKDYAAEVAVWEATKRNLDNALADATTQLTAATAKQAELVVLLERARDRPQIHRVVTGETVSGIALAHGLAWPDLAAWNGLTEPYTINPGDVLVLFADEPEVPPAPPPPPVYPPIVVSYDLGDIQGTTDEPIPEATKIATHNDLLDVPNVKHLRVFFGTSLPLWTSERMRALQPGDSVIVSTLSRDVAGIRKWAINAPDFMRVPGAIGLAHGHEQEAQWWASGKSATWLKSWLDGNKEKADLLVSLGYSDEDLYKILLHFSMEHDPKLRGTREVFYGGQNFGTWGEDIYHFQTWLNQDDKYETPEQLAGPCIAFAEQVDLPVFFPEIGGTRAATDTTGDRRAQAMRDLWVYLSAENRRLRALGKRCYIKGGNWWCAQGRMLNGVRLDHHADVAGPDSPEVAALREGAQLALS